MWWLSLLLALALTPQECVDLVKEGKAKACVGKGVDGTGWVCEGMNPRG